jgi:hypothetical protein
MLSWFKTDPKKKLEKEYNRMLEDAMLLQRGGDIKGYALKMEEAEAIQKELEALDVKTD